MSEYKIGVLDITKPEFDVDVYMAKLLKEKNLDELVREEEEMVASVRRLDSDVHQIVYENYNKFLTATNTVRKIQDEFTQLDAEINSLSNNMKNISSLITDLGDVLGSKKDGILQLGSSYKVVKSLQSIFELPLVLQGHFDEKNYSEVNRLYCMAKESLKTYEDVENVQKLLAKCEHIYNATQRVLLEHIENPTSSTEAVSKSVDLLLSMGKDREEVHGVLMKCSKSTLRKDLAELGRNHADVLDLVDKACGTFIPNLTLIATTHLSLFPEKETQLLEMVKQELDSFHQLVSRIFLSSNDAKDCSIVVRALDRYYRKISTCRHIIPGLDFSPATIELINEVASHEIDLSVNRIHEEMKAVLAECRQELVTDKPDLSQLANKIEQTFIHKVKTSLANLLLFTASDVTFASLPPEAFQMKFALNTHERLLVQAFDRLLSLAEEYSTSLTFASPQLPLVFATTLQHLANKSASYLLSLCREQFSLAAASQVTAATQVISDLKTHAQALIRCFVERRGLDLGETLIKGCTVVSQPSASPTGPRAAIRSVVDEISGIDRLLAVLLGGETKAKDARPTRRPGAPGMEIARDSLWCERIDFHQHIHFNKASIVTAIIKILLKTFIETARIHTYGKFAAEQFQVDCYFLQRGLATLAADEVVVNSMVDQALSSVLKRCHEPVLMHPSQLAKLCEKQK